MLLKELIESLGEYAPFSLQESYDNSGIQVGSPEQEVSKGLVCLDVTRDVVKEAIEKKCDLIISHHPLIFKGLKSVSSSSAAGSIIFDAIKNGIAIIALHTNLDNAFMGVSHIFGKKLGLNNMRILKPTGGLLKKLVTFCPVSHAGKVREALFSSGAGHIGEYDSCSFNLEGLGSFRGSDESQPFTGKAGQLHFEKEERIETIFPSYLQGKIISAMKSAHPYEEVAYDIYPLDNLFDRAGSGVVGNLDSELEVSAFLDLVKEKLGCQVLRYSNPGVKSIKKLAVCGGSGAFLTEQAVQSGADAFITGDVKYHQFFDIGGDMMLVDAGHYETEQFTRELMVEIVKKKMINFALLISEVNTNPVRYY